MALFEADEGDSKEVLAAKLVERVRAAWSHRLAPVVFEIINTIYEDLGPLITLLSAEGDNVADNALEKISALRRHMLIIIEDPAGTVVNPALDKFHIKLPSAEHKELAANVKTVAEVASQKLEKHFPPIVAFLEHRFRYMPRRKPESLPVDKDVRKAFIGCLQSDDTAKIVGEYEAYFADVTALRAADEAKPVEARTSLQLESYKYWDDKKLIWPTLSKVAKWHLNFPTGNISAERACAELRGIEAVWQRNQMSHATIRREIKYTYNRSVLVRLLRRELAHLQTL